MAFKILPHRRFYQQSVPGKLLVTSGKQLLQLVSRDVKDDKFLACAVEAKADYIITGDKDLLVLKEYEGIKIVTHREFLESHPVRT